MTEASKSKLRVFLADDHPVVLDGIRSRLDADPAIEIVGEAGDGQEALRMALELRPEIVVMDLSMPELNGVEVARRLLAEYPTCRVIVLTVHEDRAYIRKLIEVGASGYVLKRSMPEDLLRAIHSVANGGLYIDPAIAGKAFDAVAPRAPHAANRSVELSERETEVLRLAALGHSNKEIASKLSLSVKSVETYKSRGMDKAGLTSRVRLVGFAIEQGWMSVA